MKLIDEKEVEEGAYNSEDCEDLGSFTAGVNFAEQKLLPMMVEFVEEIIGDGWILRADGWQNVMDYKVPEFERRTTQQLLEEFIKSKNK